MNKTLFLIVGFLAGIYVSIQYPAVGDQSFSLVQDGVTFITQKFQELSAQLPSG